MSILFSRRIHATLPQAKSWLPLLPILAMAFLLHGYMIFNSQGNPYPSGSDYGQHIFYSEQYLQQGFLPKTIPYFDLGKTHWSTLPGGALTFATLSAVSGVNPFDTLLSMSIYALIEISGTFLLARYIFRSVAAAWITAAIAALLPSVTVMLSWANYPNVIALAFFPWLLLVWLRYWDRPGIRSGALVVILVVGTASLHHLSTVWLVLTLGLFSAVEFIRHPRATLIKLVPIGIVGLVVGLPVIPYILSLSSTVGGAAGSANRFMVTQIGVPDIYDLLTPLGFIFVLGGLFLFSRTRTVTVPSRILIISYALVSIFFSYSWVVGIQFYYVRALYFLALPAAFGATILLIQWRSRLRISVLALLLIGIGSYTMVGAAFQRRVEQILSPQVIEGVDWLKRNSQPDDVFAVGVYFGFQFPRLLQRPILVGLLPRLVGNAEEIPYAAAAVSILQGDPATKDLIVRYNVKYVVVCTNPHDLPDPTVSLSVLSSSPLFQRVYENADLVVFRVQ